MAFNKRVVERMIERIESVPESYDQGAFYVEPSDSAPCGTVACLAGEAVICSASNYDKGLQKAHKLSVFDVSETARRLLGLPEGHHLFGATGSGFPAPFNKQFKEARTKKQKAQVAVAYLREALKRETMVW